MTFAAGGGLREFHPPAREGDTMSDKQHITDPGGNSLTIVQPFE
jgi:hypothetical protein